MKAYEITRSYEVFPLSQHCLWDRFHLGPNGSSTPKLGFRFVRGFEKDWWGWLCSARGGDIYVSGTQVDAHFCKKSKGGWIRTGAEKKFSLFRPDLSATCSRWI